MLLNIARAEAILARHGLDAVVGASPENVLYLTGFECTTHWINKGFQQYAVFSPGHDPKGTLIAPGLEIDSLVEGENWMEDIIVFSPFPRGQAGPGVSIDEVGRKGLELTKRASTVATARSRRMTEGRRSALSPPVPGRRIPTPCVPRVRSGRATSFDTMWAALTATTMRIMRARSSSAVPPTSSNGSGMPCPRESKTPSRR